jgi:hypothetical protein
VPFIIVEHCCNFVCEQLVDSYWKTLSEVATYVLISKTFSCVSNADCFTVVHFLSQSILSIMLLHTVNKCVHYNPNQLGFERYRRIVDTR